MASSMQCEGGEKIEQGGGDVRREARMLKQSEQPPQQVYWRQHRQHRHRPLAMHAEVATDDAGSSDDIINQSTSTKPARAVARES